MPFISWYVANKMCVNSDSPPLEQTLLDDNRRKTMAATNEAVHRRVSKERQRKADKGMSLADLVKELGSEEAHKKKECMKEVFTYLHDGMQMVPSG